MHEANCNHEAARGREPVQPRPRAKKVVRTVGVGLLRAVAGQMISLLFHHWWEN